jgi:3,4-dihydroxy 2-butanone 4-phosphate synthase
MPQLHSLPPADTLPDEVRAAAEALARGEPVLFFDAKGREEETDLLVAAEHCTPEMVRLLRQDGGGLVFLAVDATYGDLFGLPFAQDLNELAAERYPLLNHTGTPNLPYDARSSFSLWVNHRDTFTGITDNDRSLTIKGLAQTAQEAEGLPDGDRNEAAMRLFGERFRSPGHVSLCVGHREGLAGRQGHTELACTLARLAGITPIVAGWEMLDGETGRALSLADAEKYARQNGRVFLRGETLLEADRRWRETTIRDA